MAALPRFCALRFTGLLSRFAARGATRFNGPWVAGALLWYVFAVAAPASVIDVTTASQVHLNPHHRLAAYFGVWNYSLANPGASPFPTSLRFTAVFLPPASTPEPVPGTSASYYPLLFEVYLQSSDGSLSYGFLDDFAEQLGLPAGSAVLRPGSFCQFSSCWSDVAVLQASINLALDEAEALFGPELWSYDSAARVWLRPLAGEATLGISNSGLPLNQFVFVSNLQGEGPVVTGAVPGRIELVENPEPSTVLLIVPLSMFLLWLRRTRKHPA